MLRTAAPRAQHPVAPQFIPHAGMSIATLVGCVGRKRTLGGNRFFLDMQHWVGNGSVSTFNNGLISYYNAPSSGVVVPDSPMVAVVQGTMSLMDADSMDTSRIPEDVLQGIDLGAYDFILDADKLFPHRSLDVVERPLFPSHQCSTLTICGVAANCQRDRTPNSFTMDVEVYQSTWKRQGAATRPTMSILAVFSETGRFKNTKSKPLPTNNRFVAVTGMIVAVEYNKMTSRADGSPIPVRFTLDIQQICFLGTLNQDHGIANGLDGPSGSTGACSPSCFDDVRVDAHTSPFSRYHNATSWFPRLRKPQRPFSVCYVALSRDYTFLGCCGTFRPIARACHARSYCVLIYYRHLLPRLWPSWVTFGPTVPTASYARRSCSWDAPPVDRAGPT
ncbi:hypothetical protein NMY22_g12604 [Coprinellus aureogranulatus]|nr:hypothetical protein NMY22_g12604 [Coprinellus aureogranulatus]